MFTPCACVCICILPVCVCVCVCACVRACVWMHTLKFWDVWHLARVWWDGSLRDLDGIVQTEPPCHSLLYVC